jgi:hypothetical protein
MKISAKFFSWRDSFSFCGTTCNPHWLWLAARVEFQIFSGRQVFCLDSIFQTQQNQSKAFTGKQETHTTMQAVKFYIFEPPISRMNTNKTETKNLRRSRSPFVKICALRG